MNDSDMEVQLVVCNICGDWKRIGERCQSLSCKERRSEQKHSRYRRIRALGLCTTCITQPAAAGLSKCQKCHEIHLEYSRQRHRKAKDECFKHYGGYICAQCGDTRPEVLQLDHIYNNGTIHRKFLNKYGGSIYRQLKKMGFPPGLQVLCANCNMLKQIYRDSEIPDHLIWRWNTTNGAHN